MYKTMPRPTKQEPERGDARTRLLDASLSVFRQKGYTATTIDDLCEVASVTKGAYAHHFKNKEALGVASAYHWSETTSREFENAEYNGLDDPLDRILGYIDFRRTLIDGAIADWTCLAGTMTQEVFLSHPEIRDACAQSIFGHAATLELNFEEAMAARNIVGEWTAKSLAQYIQVVLQGAFVAAKASNSATVALESIDHLRRYICQLFEEH